MTSYNTLGDVSCVVLNDFGNLLSIAFGINLALPVFRELVVFNRQTIVKRLVALQQLVETQTYENKSRRTQHMSSLSRSRITLAACDKELGEKIKYLSVVTFLFSLASLFWMFIGIYDRACLSPLMIFFSVGLTFIPLPASLFYLASISQTRFRSINTDLDQLMKDIM
ncbi:hypothetical protein [Mesorhizobium sp. LNJC403B00]|uniref:hypothetical protein n=1 Tax=Mesorhizobium sp. LNJC403B00 TaxID=1287280 RepID=UPI0003CE961A|nr:hypothetical protein [Mesorhizobium sp. LNJC403B00]ESX88273.1 hypothetical protein X754_27015 [Mesorhizobium sp. LNJC403B00]